MHADRARVNCSRRRFAQLALAIPMAAAAHVRFPQAAHDPEQSRAANEWRNTAVEIIAKFRVPMGTEPGFVFRP